MVDDHARRSAAGRARAMMMPFSALPGQPEARPASIREDTSAAASRITPMHPLALAATAVASAGGGARGAFGWARGGALGGAGVGGAPPPPPPGLEPGAGGEPRVGGRGARGRGPGPPPPRG